MDDWTVKAGSVMGPYHEKFGGQNQDSFTWSFIPGGIALLAADGAGSQDLSHVGSKLACSVGLATLRFTSALPMEERVKQAIDGARAALLDHDESSRMGCTLAVALLAPEGYAVGTVGDALAVVHDEEGLHLFTDESQPYVNQTTFLTSKTFEKKVFVSDRSPLAGAVATDGIARVGIKGGKAFEPFWLPLFSGMSDEAFKPDFVFDKMRGADVLEDDSTLVLAASPR